MKLTYQNISAFMQRYLEAWTNQAQNPDTRHKMYEFYSPYLRVFQYAPVIAEFDRESFLEFSSCHPDIYEELTAGSFIIDEKQKQVAALLKPEYTLKPTGEVVRLQLSAHYTLEIDEKNTIKIRELIIFCGAVPRGQTDVHKLYEKAMDESKKQKEWLRSQIGPGKRNTAPLVFPINPLTRGKTNTGIEYGQANGPSSRKDDLKS